LASTVFKGFTVQLVAMDIVVS